MNRVQCPECQTVQKVDNARFCHYCGAQLASDNVVKDDKKKNEDASGKKIFDINETVPRS